MDFDRDKTARLNALLGGFRVWKGLSKKELAMNLGLPPSWLLPDSDNCCMHLCWSFSNAQQVISALSEHYGIAPSDLWAHVLEGSAVRDVP
jgi:hypothetical protein